MLNLFNPLTVAEAHQQALTIEAQTKVNFSSWSSSRPPRNPPTFDPLPTTTEPVIATPETAIVPIDPPCNNRLGTFRCFSCGEPGHRLVSHPDFTLTFPNTTPSSSLVVRLEGKFAISSLTLAVMRTLS
ncbi:conserved hypothetical protein [Ricinus communis]|uniref:CCHC-type domain-containing protein n=1 Tax=Ricinus communis TaxID=3988 RepID=B9SUV4_RICCO|nr:conserved hypothetical protein [Ricinus communis]